MSGHVGDLSPSQETALAAFRAAVADIPNKPEENDYFYLRWLRARKFDPNKALEMFRNHMSVRQEYGLDTILDDYHAPEVFQYNPGGFFGEDRDGHPMWYDRIGRMDLRGWHRSVHREDVIKTKLFQLERRAMLCKEFSERKGRRIDTVTLVLDFEGLTFNKAVYWPGLELVRLVIKVTEANSPETVKTTFIVRAPSIFPLLFNIVKPMMNERTRQKIKVLGSNWREELQKYVAPEQLPQDFGGTRCEPDPECTDHIRPGGDIPERYYLSNLTIHNKEDMSSVLVASRRRHVVELEVTAIGSILKWEFLTDNYDIGFGITLDGDEVTPVDRKECHIFPDSGAHVCEQTGTYCLVFDNSFSWTRSKQLYYSVEVVPPSPN
ncbi:SEC14-like protein 4 [Halichondria panicea]|uniref:SEC14-like protein 4 n=1 Tax=Halichondria panicea TaxID=6063 RepID=UPI00312BBE1D